MKTEYANVNFTPVSNNDQGKTQRYLCTCTVSSEKLGFVVYYSIFNNYFFAPADNIELCESDLRDMTSFIAQLNNLLSAKPQKEPQSAIAFQDICQVRDSARALRSLAERANVVSKAVLEVAANELDKLIYAVAQTNK